MEQITLDMWIKENCIKWEHEISQSLIEHAKKWDYKDRLHKYQSAVDFIREWLKVTNFYFVFLNNGDYYECEFLKSDRTAVLRKCGRDFDRNKITATVSMDDVICEFNKEMEDERTIII